MLPLRQAGKVVRADVVEGRGYGLVTFASAKEAKAFYSILPEELAADALVELDERERGVRLPRERVLRQDELGRALSDLKNGTQVPLRRCDESVHRRLVDAACGTQGDAG